MFYYGTDTWLHRWMSTQCKPIVETFLRALAEAWSLEQPRIWAERTLLTQDTWLLSGILPDKGEILVGLQVQVDRNLPGMPLRFALLKHSIDNGAADFWGMRWFWPFASKYRTFGTFAGNANGLEKAMLLIDAVGPGFFR